MTVAEKGEHEGVLAEVVSEAGLNTDTPQVALETREGRLRATLTVGVNLFALVQLSANAELGIKGFMPYGRGFMISPEVMQSLTADDPQMIGRYIRKYVNGRDLNQKSRQSYVIDLHGLDVDHVRMTYPRTYQYLLQNVKPERDQNPMEYRREKWWLFGGPATSCAMGWPDLIATSALLKPAVTGSSGLWTVILPRIRRFV